MTEPRQLCKLYHGGLPGRQRGSFLLPPVITGSASLSEFGADGVHRRDRVYITTEMNAALLYAASVKNGVIYEVEPIGDVEPDPDCTMNGLSFQCDKARVLRVIKPKWHAIDMARKVLIGSFDHVG